MGEGGCAGEGIEFAAELEGYEGLFEVVCAEGGEVGGRGRGREGTARRGWSGGHERKRVDYVRDYGVYTLWPL